jgi:hypothetical protein
VWSRAAILTDFSQYAPADGTPAENQTDVLVWYSPTAIFFGIRAHARPGTLRATLANRDRISDDDHVQIYLSTFNDGRQALVFAVSPLGVQADGTLVGAAPRVRRHSPRRAGDRPQRRLRLRIEGPPHRLRLRGRDPHPVQDARQPREAAGLGPARHPSRAEHGVRGELGARARRAARVVSPGRHAARSHGPAAASCLDLNPVVTAKADPGGESDSGSALRHGLARIRQQRPLGHHAEPDDERHDQSGLLAGRGRRRPVRLRSAPSALLLEKRPFFLDGIEQFQTPNNLIYTPAHRRAVGAAKLTGKSSGTRAGVTLSPSTAPSRRRAENYPVFNILRVQRDVGAESKAAFVYGPDRRRQLEPRGAPTRA